MGTVSVWEDEVVLEMNVVVSPAGEGKVARFPKELVMRLWARVSSSKPQSLLHTSLWSM